MSTKRQPSSTHPSTGAKKAKIRPNIIQESDSSESETGKKSVVREKSGRFKRKYEIPADCKQHGDREIEKLLTKWELTVDKVATSLIGNRPIELGTTAKQYMNLIHGFKFYCYLVGDAESLVILLEKKPSFCPSINPKTIANYVKFKTEAKDEIHCGIDGNPVKDYLGTTFNNDGGWKDPLVSRQLMAALHLAHAARGQAGPYQEKCEQCLSGKTACNRPHSIPHLWRLGDPTKVSLVSNQQKSVIKSNKEYVVQGDMPVTVDELLKIRNHLVSQNSTEVSQYLP
jgi:hypothetical protein